MLFRTLLPLLLLISDENKSIAGRTRFQKLIFLTQKESSENWYSFIPYNYGPYSLELQNDLDILIEMELISEEQETLDDGRIFYRYSVTREGLYFIQKLLNDVDLKDRISKIIFELNLTKKRYQGLSLDQLINLVYSKYPEFTGQSVYQQC